jgi:hypothetical protein
MKKRGDRRVEVFCVGCKRFFRYMYKGIGPYRSVCPKCKKAKVQA